MLYTYIYIYVYIYIYIYINPTKKRSPAIERCLLYEACAALSGRGSEHSCEERLGDYRRSTRAGSTSGPPAKGSPAGVLTRDCVRTHRVNSYCRGSQYSGGTACLTLLVEHMIDSNVATTAASSISRIIQVMP